MASYMYKCRREIALDNEKIQTPLSSKKYVREDVSIVIVADLCTCCVWDGPVLARSVTHARKEPSTDPYSNHLASPHLTVNRTLPCDCRVKMAPTLRSSTQDKTKASVDAGTRAGYVRRPRKPAHRKPVARNKR